MAGNDHLSRASWWSTTIRDIRDSLREVLEDEGYDVSCAGNGREALEHLKAACPDLA